MTVGDTAVGLTCHILREDPALAGRLEPAQRARAIDECVARTMRVGPGHWDGEVADDMTGGIGLLILDGLLMRRVGVDGRFGGEVLGSGDLLRPWQGEDAVPTMSRTTGWRVLEPAHLAILDRPAADRIAQFPELTGQLVERALERSRNLSLVSAIIHRARVELRLLMLLWHLAERWGRVRSDGLAVPIRLTHRMLADLVAAGRPTVSTAMAELTRQGLVRPMDRGGWVLLGNPPGTPLELDQGAISPPRHRRRAARAANRRSTFGRG